uniref:Uncharacterized protein n=1 Tax=Oryza punctata TaxID=4537 RepID=A0A0E0LMW6_ORYPU
MANTTMVSGINEGRLLVFLIVLYASTIAGSIGCRILGARLPDDDLAAWRSDGLNDDAAITCMSFAALTLAMQAMLACVLEEKPAAAAARRPASARLPWLVAAMSWMCVTSYFVAYVTLGGNVAPTSLEWTAAGVASAANLAIATRTVWRHVGVSNPAKDDTAGTVKLTLRTSLRSSFSIVPLPHAGEPDQCAASEHACVWDSVYVATSAGSLFCRLMSSIISPEAAVARRSGGLNNVVTCVVFAVLTASSQAFIACFMEEVEPAPAATTTTRAERCAAWAVGVFTGVVTSLCISSYFFNYIGAGGVAPTSLQWTIAAAISVANFVFVTPTILAVCPGAGITGVCVSGGEDFTKTCFAFALLTVASQAHLASVLLMEEKKRNPARPPPPPASWAAWLLAVCTWASFSGIFLAYISYAGFVAATSLEWAVTGVASAVNLAVAACTVLVKLQVYLIATYTVAAVGLMGCRLVGMLVCPDAVAGWRSVAVGLDVATTCVCFALLTLPLQASLACLLEKKKPATAWLVSVCCWISISSNFFFYITYGGSVAPTSLEWTVAGVASAANLVIAVRTVLNPASLQAVIGTG